MLTVAGTALAVSARADDIVPAPTFTTPADHAERLTRGTDTFIRHVRSRLTEHCVSCHGGDKTQGGLDLTTREALFRGGDDGPVVIPYDTKASRLLDSIAHKREPFMPKKASKLSEADIAHIASWIHDGAPYDRPLINQGNATASGKPAPSKKEPWWAFEPLVAAATPEVRNTHWIQTPIDRFILAPLEASQLSPVPAAERRALLRRVHLDLLGMPPTPEEVEAFVNDPAPTQDAWRIVVRRLLERPQYGERWARYWLDVARFAESSGFEHDYDRPAAYHYRDFVIRALNDDMPYDQFVRWQLAGDEFAPDEPLALMATGFLGAGVFPTQITANEVERTRYDAMDDMLATTGTAMLGLTVGCARCHDHKFDPISTQEYYRLLSTFTTTTCSELDLNLDPATFLRDKASFDAAQSPLDDAVRAYEERELPYRMDAWIASGAALPSQPGWQTLEFSGLNSQAGATFRRLDDGSYRVEGKNGDTDRYTFTVNLADSSAIAALRLEALADPSMVKGGPGRADNGNMGLSRIRIFTGSTTDSTASNEVLIASAQATFEQNTNNLAVAKALDTDPHTGWAVDPRFGTNHAAVFIFAKPLPAESGRSLTVVLEFQVNSRHNIGRPRISVTSDPRAPLDGGSLPASISAILAKLNDNSANPSVLTATERVTLQNWWKPSDPAWKSLADTAEIHRRTVPKPKLTKVLTCTEGNTPVRMHTQGADFFPDTYFLNRGSTDQKRGVATQGFLQVLSRAQDPEHQWAWTPPTGAKFSGRRRILANWITDTQHGAGHLLARVIVNRVWQHHFGRGLVETPNDFGVQGSRPSHPELLDWLASELIRHGWKLKTLHEQILTSAAYQVGTDRAPSASAAPLTGRESYRAFVPRRLTAEAIRDSVLSVSGALDPRMYGPGTLDPASTRRSVYFTVKRSQLVPAMQVFDAPEPLVSQATRPATTVAPQALLLMNSPQLRTWAERFARRIAPEPGTTPARAVRRAYTLALSRPPTATELQTATAFLEQQAEAYRSEDRASRGSTEPAQLALTDLAQAMLSLNEFVYVE